MKEIDKEGVEWLVEMDVLQPNLETRTMKQQLAVEWLYQHLFPKQLDGFSEEEWSKIDTAFEQAKEMQKKQIIEAHFNGCEIGEMFNNENRAFITDSQQYYNKTFKENDK